MNHKPDPEMVDDENSEWTEDDFARAVPFSRLPPSLQANLQSQPHSLVVETADEKPRLFPVPIAEDIVATFQDMGDGWEQRVNDVLREWLIEHFPYDQS